MLSACIFDPETDLDTRTWDEKKKNIISYSYKLAWYCECLPESAGPFLVEATPYEVTKVRRLTGGSTPDTIEVTSGLQQYSLDTLIAETRQGLDRMHASASVRYNTAFGFPEFVYIDFNAMIADEEYQWEITNFEAILGD